MTGDQIQSFEYHFAREALVPSISPARHDKGAEGKLDITERFRIHEL